MNNQQLTNHFKQVTKCDLIITIKKTIKQIIKICCEINNYINELYNAL